MLIYDKGYDLLNPLDAIERNKQDIQAFKDANKTIAEFGITVVDELSNISINTLPNKLDYKYGEELFPIFRSGVRILGFL